MDFTTDIKKLEKAIRDTENALKKYTTMFARLEEDSRAKSLGNAFLLDERVYGKIMKTLKDTKSMLENEEREVDSCINSIDSRIVAITPVIPNVKRKGKDVMSPIPKFKRPKKGDWVINIGCPVAAKQTKQQQSQWILASVVSYNSKTGRYEVEDPEEEELAAKRFTVNSKEIIPLPPDPQKVKEGHDPSLITPTGNYLLEPFADGTKVLAMFPATTAFYPAVVSGNQKGTKSHRNLVAHYLLQFEDDHEDGFTPSRRVSSQHVVPWQK
eukprot:TRINITY_DN3626_c0_g1_i1.p1 TRINITY_DN3626_c0_g1~~TRINITY_DN3626_c0_g1_i1.p1  ORF type:complete len:269 (+),score=36.20 TRINITY_DN3626_c0_g1_i1:404-1210(+)